MLTNQDYGDFVDAVVLDPGWADVLLARQPDLLEARNGLGETPLTFLSIAFFGLGAIAWLLNRGADINATDEFGGSALLYALTLYRRPLADYLIARGASLRFSYCMYRSVADLAEMEDSVDWKSYLNSLTAARE
jgi:ankyrin repeat protein